MHTVTWKCLDLLKMMAKANGMSIEVRGEKKKKRAREK